MEVVHRLPGRSRLRFRPGGAANGHLLALRLAGHPAVVSVRWRPANRSLTVEHLPHVGLDALLGNSGAVRQVDRPGLSRREPSLGKAPRRAAVQRRRPVRAEPSGFGRTGGGLKGEAWLPLPLETPNRHSPGRLPETAGSGFEQFFALGLALLSGNLAEALLVLLPVLLPGPVSAVPKVY